MSETHFDGMADHPGDDFERLTRFFAATATALPTLSDPYHRRLVGALASVSAGDADIAVLIRQALRREHERRLKEAGSIVPSPTFAISDAFAHPRWPSRRMWSEVGVATTDREGTTTLRANPWTPEWLDLGPGEDPAAAADSGELRRGHRPIEGDPFLAAAGRSTYLCSGQKDAVRAVMMAPRGATLLVNIPTGAGKSLCAHLPSELNKDELTVVVVPTTALCVDQDQAVHNRIGHATAFFSGHAQNSAILSRINAGTQRIVFCSPESMSTALGSAVRVAAAAGRLRWLVVDEAHIVDQWGDEFRPAFQELAGLRLAMLRACSDARLRFSTLLLSATVTTSSYDTLATLFAVPGPFDVVSSVQLRPEPSYFFSYCGDGAGAEQTKFQRVMEAVLRLPRPLLLYTTLVADADVWYADLRRKGFGRIDRVTGKTPPDERERVLSRWRAGTTDIVVATSAFGLGVDQPEVRAVVHACVPENLDRFYQEVGRGGRDGRACVSLTVYTKGDVEAARGINRRKIISIELGLERWQTMFRSARALGGDRFSVPLNAARAFDMDSRANEAWNARTLTLMARSGVIDLDAEPLPTPSADEGLRTTAAVRDEPQWRTVLIREHLHTDRRLWEERIEPERARTFERDRRNMKLMRNAMGAKRCLGDVLAEMYMLPGIRVAHACGGCPHCRRNGRERTVEPMPPAPPVWEVQPLRADLHSLFAGDTVLTVTYVRDQWRDWRNGLGPLVEWFVDQGTGLLVFPEQIRGRLFDQFRTRTTPVFIENLQTFQPLWAPRMPAAILHPPELAIPLGCYHPDPGAPRRVIMLPSHARDPENPERELAPMLRRRIEATELKVRLGI